MSAKTQTYLWGVFSFACIIFSPSGASMITFWAFMGGFMFTLALEDMDEES